MCGQKPDLQRSKEQGGKRLWANVLQPYPALRLTAVHKAQNDSRVSTAHTRASITNCIILNRASECPLKPHDHME